MRHISTKSNSMVVEVALGFADIYQKPYIATAYLDEIKQANLLVLPSENIREGLEPVFPELTTEFLYYLRTHASEKIKVDIAVDDEHYHKLVLHASAVALATLLIKDEVLEETTDLVTGFLKELAEKNNRFEDEMDAFVNIIVEGSYGCRKIMFRGRVSELREALDKAVEQGFRGVKHED